MAIFEKIKKILFVNLRIFKYRILSECQNVSGKPNLFHPLLLKGKGNIKFGKNVQIGVISSPNYFSHYSYIEARESNSSIEIGDNVAINNNFSAVANIKISIGNDVLIGVNCSIIDSDGHDLNANKRNNGIPKSIEVIIENNVFIGSNVTILKGVTIGENAVIGNSAVVTKSVPANSVAVGNPAKVIRNLI